MEAETEYESVISGNVLEYTVCKMAAIYSMFQMVSASYHTYVSYKLAAIVSSPRGIYSCQPRILYMCH